jgi:transcriptional regulator with XRE-family HTH domain
MDQDLRSVRQKALLRLLRQKRQEAELTQRELADRLGRPPSFVSDCETGQHRVSVLDFCDFADALGFDPRAAIRRIHGAKKPAKGE